MLQCVAVCCSVLQCVAMCDPWRLSFAGHLEATPSRVLSRFIEIVLQCVAVWCSVWSVAACFRGALGGGGRPSVRTVMFH